jgi:hypothetical protein
MRFFPIIYGKIFLIRIFILSAKYLSFTAQNTQKSAKFWSKNITINPRFSPPRSQGSCVKSIGNENCQDIMQRTVTKGETII